MSRRHKRAHHSAPVKPQVKAEDIAAKLTEWFVHFKCEKVPNVVLFESRKQHGDLYDSYKVPKIFLGIHISDKVGQVNKLTCTNFFMESATILAIQKFSEEIPFNITILILENCNLTADHIRSLALILSKKQILEELVLNGNPNDEQNHHLLLKCPRLWSCSLKFCGIDKEGMTKIAEVVRGSTSMIHLNLTGNSLYDEGMEPVSDMLRVNRTLLSLNLTDNKIRNEGCVQLMEVFKLFILRYEEVVLRRRMFLEYFKEKLRKKSIISEQAEQGERKLRLRRKSKERMSVKSSKLSAKKKTFGSLIESEIDHHPFLHDSIEVGSDVCCKGNDVLFSLNLSFNQIGLTGLKCIEDVLEYQKVHFINRGLIRLVLQGNITTEDCLTKIGKLDEILNRDHKKSVSMAKLKKLSKPRLT